MDVAEFIARVTENLGFEPTPQQQTLVAALARFCAPSESENSVFLLNGYAGTGKTSVMAALVKTLREAGRNIVLLAPTGRAAKILGSSAGYPASTIHRKIYTYAVSGEFGGAATNNSRDTVFIVDEASMIGNDPDSSLRTLLDNLIEYVYSGDGCRMILLGDSAQLPPVGLTLSPAMNPDILREHGLRVTRAVLTQTVRQAQDSGILYNSTRLRKAMTLEALPEPTLKVSGFSDIKAVDAVELQDALETCYSEENGADETVIITRSNRRALDFNMAVRNVILDREESVCVGDRLVIAKNNYLWSAKTPGMSFIANGDIATIVKIYGSEYMNMIRFMDVRLLFPDRNGIEIDLKICEPTLFTENTPKLTSQLEAMRRVRLIASGVTSESAAHRFLRSDPYINALNVRYAYAMTCHKAQGGQWRNVFIDLGGIAPEALTTTDLYRWLYTSITRATKKVYLINPSINVI